MITEKSPAQLAYDNEKHTYLCQGFWSITHLDALDTNVAPEVSSDSNTVFISGAELKQLDSSGALALYNIAETLRQQGYSVEWVHFSKQQESLLALIDTKKEALFYHPTPPIKHNPFFLIGKEALHKVEQANGFIVLLGDLGSKMFDAMGHWRRFRLPGIASNVESAGIQSLPIVALLSFLIGVVLAYQMGLQLKTYGANIFIAYLSGMAILREFAPLITAIIVAGRTSSAFTAQIGSMKVNEEIDALYTMGLSPTELLVMPKVIGLMFVFPLLIFWADFFSLIGAMFMSKGMLDIGYFDFLARLKESVGLKQLMLGLYKAPIFALIIALVGCFQGFLVQPNADSIGSQTTRSVVQALFLIIVADAAFSIFYSWLGL